MGDPSWASNHATPGSQEGLSMTLSVSPKTLQSPKKFFGVCLSLVLASLMSGCNSTSSKSAEDEETTAKCTEPENPYSEGSGHSAGFEWAEKNGSGGCNG